jgi:thiamine pyrophosphokinase
MEVVVFAGGDPLDRRWADALPRDAHVVAADSGLELVHAHDLTAHLLVGDMDSVRDETRDHAVQRGTAVERHPTDKDATDLELALAAAKAAGATRMLVVGAGGGRLDHFLANVLLLAAPDWAGIDVHALIGPAHLVVVRDQTTLHGAVGSTVSLLPADGPAQGITTSGLRWPLRDEDLHPGTTRGVSNEMTDPTATVALRSGVLVAVQPDATPIALTPPTEGH